ncbi:MAG: hypothetical protein H6713_12545 [Myxococcales bacterium]|nr:hypothetical protein [Myxococcales bacterium]
MSQRAVAIATELGVLRELDALRLLSIETVRGRVITFIVELPGRACSPPKHGLALRCRITLDCVMAYRLLARPRWDPAAFNTPASAFDEIEESAWVAEITARFLDPAKYRHVSIVTDQLVIHAVTGGYSLEVLERVPVGDALERRADATASSRGAGRPAGWATREYPCARGVPVETPLGALRRFRDTIFLFSVAFSLRPITLELAGEFTGSSFYPVEQAGYINYRLRFHDVQAIYSAELDISCNDILPRRESQFEQKLDFGLLTAIVGADEPEFRSFQLGCYDDLLWVACRDYTLELLGPAD